MIILVGTFGDTDKKFQVAGTFCQCPQKFQPKFKKIQKNYCILKNVILQSN